jgi:hypothetical protein
MDAAAPVSFYEDYPVGTGDVVFLGDSITVDGQWSETLPGVAVKDWGISGDVMAGPFGMCSPAIGCTSVGKGRWHSLVEAYVQE